MFDINSILTQALAAAVAEATKPLVERIAALETRLLALENNPAQGVDTTLNAWELERRVAILETHTSVLKTHTAVLDQHGGILEYLDNQEWFWEKLHNTINDNVASRVEQAIDAHLENASHYDEDDIDTKIEEAIEHHEEQAYHLDENDIEEMVQKLLNNASISISISV
jgi:hypothetical protein